MRQTDAQDVADELMAKLKRRRVRLGLFITPSGEYRIIGAGAVKFLDWSIHWPHSLVGVYDSRAERTAVIADIEERCREIELQAWRGPLVAPSDYVSASFDDPVYENQWRETQ